MNIVPAGKGGCAVYIVPYNARTINKPGCA